MSTLINRLKDMDQELETAERQSLELKHSKESVGRDLSAAKEQLESLQQASDSEDTLQAAHGAHTIQGACTITYAVCIWRNRCR